MKRLLFALIVTLPLTLAHQSSAASFFDDFSTNPFVSGGARWCERWHHMHWDSINLLMSGVDGTSCAGFSCCSCCGVTGCNCSQTNIGGFFLITMTNYSGATRSAKTEFAIQTPLTSSLNEHVALYSVTHPNCHAGAQAFVFREPEGDYALNIAHIDEGDGIHSECGQLGTKFGTEVRNLTLATSTLPRYKLTLTTGLSGSNISSTATLVDLPTGTTLATTSFFSLKPTWYNNQAKRFGMGGIRTNVSVIPNDNFLGTYQ
jgi:hypothetical protein